MKSACIFGILYPKDREAKTVKKKVDIYCDGACSGNPGPGGYAAVLIYGRHKKEISAGFFHTTNNRMELYGAIAGLSMLSESCEVTLYTDSRYVADGLGKGWAKSWQKKGWRKADNSPALNADLWERLLLYSQEHDVSVAWVKGHAENEYNNRCDELAVAASKAPLHHDFEFEKEGSN